MIALSAITTALSVIFIVIGAFIETFDLSCLFMASVCLMLPLSKNMRLGAFLSYIATAILSFIFSGVRFQILIPYVMFFGLHPIFNEIVVYKKWNKFLAFLIKAVWFIGTLFVTYYFTSMFIFENEIILKYINIVLPIGGLIVFVIYDFVMLRFQVMTRAIIERFKF